ncbi:flagellar filament capping protein FliD [Paenibacillus sp. OV219]|uniref:flagellar filament capping protein FliD n=1 Tax=Paenibacillus sp. OV219 TaxID=1884377 RepID=UPI0008B083AF|nr:flagellar filament capping protein FliD [Paenibacillus sp. OV219]SEO90346.1 Flagellar capping protein FliD [Paenibacillus sp. OV219]
MVLPYSMPAVFGTVRHTREPVQPVERYALYPYSGQGYLSLMSQNTRKQVAASIPARGSVGSFTLPKQAQAALKAAANSSADWLAQSKKVSSALSDIRMKGKSAFEQRSVQVDGTGTAGVTGDADASAARTDYSVQVASLAKSQQNQGYELTKNAPSIINSGAHIFTLQVGGQTHSLSTVIRPGDTNAAALGRLQSSINGAKLGVTASVQENQTNGTVKLVVDAGGVGTEHAFALQDQRGSIIASSGADRAVVKGSDMHVLVDGKMYDSNESNTIVLQHGLVRISLDEMTSPADFKIKVRNNSEALHSQLQSVISEVNSLQDTYDSSGYLNPVLKQRVDDVLRSPELASLGISQSQQGKWQLDEEKLGAAMEAQPDDVSRIISGRHGLASRLQQTINQLSELPTESLISTKASGFQSFTLYRASSGSYLQLPLGGLFLNSFM